jgi:hypothetical protein
MKKRLTQLLKWIAENIHFEGKTLTIETKKVTIKIIKK